MISLEEIAQKTPEEIHLLLSNLSELNERNKITLDEKDREIERLRHQLNQQLHHRFGKSSEKQENPLQERLFDEVVAPTDECVVEIELADEEITVPEHQRKKRGRKPLPKNLPRIQHIHDLSEAEKQCPCGCALTQIGQTTTEQLEFIPAQVRVIEHIQLKYACKSCEGTIRQASKPAQPIPKSIATPGLLSHIVVSKFCDHLPFYRQESIMQRMGVDIARNTLCHWAIKCADLLDPIVARMQCLMNQYDVGYSDETVVQVLKEPDRSALSNSYMWLFIGGSENQRCFIYRYHPSRAHTIPEAFWDLFTGYLHTDGFSGYQTLFNKKPITGVHCWAHARRKFIDVVKASKKAGLAHEAVKQIAQLYKIEKHCKNQGLDPGAIKDYREKKAKPILENLKRWLEDASLKVPPKSGIGGAINYTLKFWNGLTRYLEDGRLEIDNNLTERSIKPFVIGRKNWLFFDSMKGAKSGAIIYSLIETCKAHKVEPYAYLKYVLSKVRDCKTDADYDKLLPFNVDQNELAKLWGADD